MRFTSAILFITILFRGGCKPAAFKWENGQFSKLSHHRIDLRLLLCILFNPFKLVFYSLSVLVLLITSTEDTAAQTSQTFNVPGNYTFTPPSGVTNITIECWGGGGSGGNNTNGTNGRGRGGGGGGAAMTTGGFTATLGGGGGGEQLKELDTKASPNAPRLVRR